MGTDLVPERRCCGERAQRCTCPRAPSTYWHDKSQPVQQESFAPCWSLCTSNMHCTDACTCVSIQPSRVGGVFEALRCMRDLVTRRDKARPCSTPIGTCCLLGLLGLTRFGGGNRKAIKTPEKQKSKKNKKPPQKPRATAPPGKAWKSRRTTYQSTASKDKVIQTGATKKSYRRNSLPPFLGGVGGVGLGDLAP